MSQEIFGCEEINLDDYEIKKVIGRGGFAIVILAIDKKTKKEVCIKAYYRSTLDRQKYREILYRSINVSNSGVPFLVKTLGYRLQLSEEQIKESKNSKITLQDDSGKEHSVDFSGNLIVMEYYKLPTLDLLTKEYLDSNGEKPKMMNPTVRSKIIFGISSIMKQLHSKNIIFRDLKPSNVFLNDDLEPVLFDFELSKYVTNPLNMTTYIGTPLFMAPELFMDCEETYSFPVDVHAFAIFLYHMFENTISFPDKKPIRSSQNFMMMRIGRGMRPVKPEKIPDHYWDLIQRCWKEDPNDRPTFAEITEELRDDKYALKEFGQQTDLDQLHEYQRRVEGETPKATSTSKQDEKNHLKRLEEYESLLTSEEYEEKQSNNFYIDESDEQQQEIESKIGEGATSITYKVNDHCLQRNLCKKVLKEAGDYQTSFKNLQNMMKEFQVMYELKHPCICRVIGINTSEVVPNVGKSQNEEITTVAMFLEFLEFKLSDVLKSGITNTLKTRIIIEIAHGMKYIHKRGLIHRDLKIDNIMLNSVYEAKIVDFGLVRIHECMSNNYSYVQTSMTRGVGTLSYMSPEMLNEEDYDYKTDVYSFGVVMYYIFFGNIPHQNLKDKMIGKEIQLPKPSATATEFCIKMIRKCLSHEPSERPSFEEIINELRSNKYGLSTNIDRYAIYHRDHELELFETK